MTESPTQETVQQETPAIELTINDLAAMREIIKIASTRGAFEAVELEAVGKAFNKLNAFIETVVATQQAATEKSNEEA
jgi:hypothetical protein